MDNITSHIETLADELAKRLKTYGYSVTYSKFLVVSSVPVPKNMALFNRLQYAVDPAMLPGIMILPVTLANTQHISLEDCTPELEAEFDEVIAFEAHKVLVKYVHNVVQEWMTDIFKTPPVQIRVTVNVPHLTVFQALEKLAE